MTPTTVESTNTTNVLSQTNIQINLPWIADVIEEYPEGSRSNKFTGQL
ncbi:hypothetical protein KHA80_21415 [Anaerobacillus sp. HL2]|nr:hypothetical protein KHA80_21415 [Anaerobacillus sp. HL2]